MYESYMTVVGQIITNPVKRITNTGAEVYSFRVASNARRFDRDTGEWVDNGTLYASVNCWNKLVANVAGSVMRGDPIIVHGIAKTNEYVTKEGVTRADLDIRAIAVGPDLSRCSVTMNRAKPAPVEPVQEQEPNDDFESDSEESDEREAVGV
ncbi:single-stranded DNA-binding protein [Actinomycetes bacterium M1A6_2h]